LNKPTISIDLDCGALQTLRAKAAELGYVIGRGKKPNMGSLRQLLLAIARGEVELRKADPPALPRNDE